MAELWRLIDAHLTHYGVTAAAFARKCDTKAQTVQNWKDHPTTLPKPHHLRAIAKVIGMPYEAVLGAALVDAGYRDNVVDDAADLRQRLDAAAGRDNETLARIAGDLAKKLMNAPPPPRLDDMQAGSSDPIADFIRRDLDREDGQDGGQQVS